MLREAWEEAGYLYLCSEFCELGNLNDYTKSDSLSLIEKTTSNQSDLSHLQLKRSSSLLVKSASGIPMLREQKIWEYFEQMLRCI